MVRSRPIQVRRVDGVRFHKAPSIMTAERKLEVLDANASKLKPIGSVKFLRGPAGRLRMNGRASRPKALNWASGTGRL